MYRMLLAVGSTFLRYTLCERTHSPMKALSEMGGKAGICPVTVPSAAATTANTNSLMAPHLPQPLGHATGGGAASRTFGGPAELQRTTANNS